MSSVQFRVDAILGDTSMLQQQLNNLRTSFNLTINNSQALQAIQQVQTQINNLRTSMSNMNLNVGGVGGGNGSAGGSSGTNVPKAKTATMSTETLQQTNALYQQISNNVDGVVQRIEVMRDAQGKIVSGTATVSDGIQTWKRNLEFVDGQYQRVLASGKDVIGIQKQMGVGTGTTLNMGGVKDINTLQTALAGSQMGWDDNTSSIRSFSQQVDNAGNTITTFTVRQEQLGANGQKMWQDTSYAVSSVDNQVRQLGQHQTEMHKSNAQSLGQQIKMQFKQYAIYYAVSAVIQGIVESISNTVHYAIDLNDALTNIRVVTMDTKDATEDLLKTYNKMGQELGASTLDIAEGAVDWLRQGFSEADTEELVKDSTILSRLAMIDNAQATEYLTSALKGYKLEAQDAIGVIDQMVAIDLEAATSAGDMAEALSRTANMARTTGFEMNEVLGMIATMSEVTQNSASMIGNSVKTILSRMSNVKAGLDDFEGEALNDVEKTLNRVGIALRDNQGNWYDFYDVLDEVASKWDTFSDVQQSQITTALGGTRQRENILVALENWDKVKQYAETGLNSAGTATEKYGIVLEGVSAKQAQLNAKTQEFITNILNSDFIILLLEIAKGFMDIMNFGNGAVGKIVLITTATLALCAGFNALKASAIGAKLATLSLSKVLDMLKAHPIIFTLSILTTAYTIIDSIIDGQKQKIQESIDKANELTEAYKTATDELKTNLKSLTETDSLDKNGNQYESLQEEFDELCKGVDRYGTNLSLTNEEYDRYKTICEQIVGLNPDLMKGYQDETEAIGNRNEALKNTIDLLKDQAKFQIQTYADNANTVLEGSQNSYRNAVEVRSGNMLTNAWGQKILDGRNSIITATADYLRDTLKGYETENEQFKFILKEVAKEIEDMSDVELLWSEFNEEGKSISSRVVDKVFEITSSYKETNANLRQQLIRDSYMWMTSIDTKDLNQLKENLGSDVQAIAQQEEILANSMNTTYEAFAQLSEKWDSLNSNSRNFIYQWIDENLTTDENTTPQMVQANRDKIDKIISEIADSDYSYTFTNNDGKSEKKIGQQIFDRLFEIDENADKLTVEQYRQQVEEALRHIVAMVNDIDATEVTERQIVEMGNLFGFKMVVDGNKGIPWSDDYDLENALIELTDEVKQEVKQKIKDGEYSQEDVEIIINAKASIKSTTDITGIDAIIANAKNEAIDATSVITDYADSLASLGEQYEILAKAQEEYNQYGNITAETMKSIIDNGLLEYLEEEAGQLVFNTEKLQENADTARDNAIAQLQASLFTDLNRIALGTYQEVSEDINGDGVVNEVDKQTEAFLKEAGAIATATDALTLYGEATGVDTSGWTDKQKKQVDEVWSNYEENVAKVNAMSANLYSNFSSNRGSSSKSGSGSGSSSSKEQWEKDLDSLKEKLENNSISMDTYITKLENLRDKQGKSTKAWKELNKELQDAKLDNLNNQFERGEITIDEYISGLKELRKAYKKGTEGYKELTQQINEQKANKYADQYERGEISLNSYVKKLTKLRDSYKKNSEEWKKYNDLIKDTKLDAVNKQYERGEITTDEYIKKLKELRKGYKKNSEEYKELTKTINETKADKYADQYERGEISLTKYISKLTKLRDSYKKNSEEWKKYNDLINDTNLDAYADMYERGEISATKYINKLKAIQETLDKDSQLYKDIGDIIENTLLDKTEKWIDKLGKARQEIEQTISELGDVNTDEERVRYAELLGDKYKKTQSDITKINNKLTTSVLTAEERVALQEELNTLLQDEVNIRDEIESGVREYYENQKEQAELQAENTKKQRLYNKEVELYGDENLDDVFKELATDEAGVFNQELYEKLKSGDKELFEYLAQQRIDYYNAEADAKEKEKEAQDKINEGEELQNNLIEARLKLQNALDNKTTKILKKQADGTWQYEYSANMADVKEAEQGVKDAEKALEDFDFNQSVQALRDEANELQESMDNLAEQYADEEFWANRDYEATMNSIAQAFGDIDGLVQDWMDKYGGNDDTLIGAYGELTNSNNTLMGSINTLNTSIEGLNETVGNKGVFSVDDGVQSYDTGGNVVGNGLIFAHDKERVLTAQQNANFEQFVAKIPSFLKAVDITKFGGVVGGQISGISNANNHSNSTVIDKVECIFPNITTTEGLQRAILELPNLALQKK